MPHDWPQLPDLVLTVREFIDDLTPRLQGQDRYHALCASYLLDIVTRELAEWAPQPTVDDARLAALVGDGETIQTSEVVSALCREIRAGDYDDRLPELLDTLTAHVRAKVAVSRPDFLQTAESGD